MRLLTSVTSMALVALLGWNAPAQDRDHSETSRDQGSAHRHTVQGTVAAVTVLGETMVNYDTGRAEVAQATFLTVVESPADAKTDDGKQGSHTQHAAKDKDQQQGAKGKDDSSGQDRGRASTGRRARVFVLALTPRTEVCERKDGDKVKCDLARLELGDRVEVEFTHSGMRSKGTAAGEQKSGENQQASGNARHGRDRIVRGEVVSITILSKGSSGDQGSDSSARQSSGDKSD
ncbi:MAG TPA: hypothetical protein VF590_18015 [Isosphaeraceae bacterium]|jgi:hypothetical protein